MRNPRPWSTRFVLPGAVHPGHLVELRQFLQRLAHFGNRLLAGRLGVHQDGCDLKQNDSTGNPQNALQAWECTSSGPEDAMSKGHSREVCCHRSRLSAVPPIHGINRTSPDLCILVKENHQQSFTTMQPSLATLGTFHCKRATTSEDPP